MSESGIFLVSIPRLSVHTGPGTRVKPVYGKKKEIRSTIKGAASVRFLYPFRVMNRRKTGSDYTCWPQHYI